MKHNFDVIDAGNYKKEKEKEKKYGWERSARYERLLTNLLVNTSRLNVHVCLNELISCLLPAPPPLRLSFSPGISIFMPRAAAFCNGIDFYCADTLTGRAALTGTPRNLRCC